MSIPLNVGQFTPAGQRVTVPLDKLQPTQVDLRPEKVARMMKKSASDLLAPFVSANGAVHDGHHRVAAALMRGERSVETVRF